MGRAAAVLTLLLLATRSALPAPSPVGRLHPGAVPSVRGLLPLGIGGGSGLFLLVGSPTTVLAAVIVLGTAVWFLRDVRAAAETGRREAAVAGFLGSLGGELRAGQPVGPAVEHATAQLPADTPPALAGALRQVSGHVGRGSSGAQAMAAHAGTVPELAGLGALWSLADRHGLPLAPLMEQAQQNLDARLRHRAATTATLQGPQATAVILTLLPLAGVALGTAMGADPVGFLFGGGLGGGLLVLGVGLAAVGFVWSRHILRRAVA